MPIAQILQDSNRFDDAGLVLRERGPGVTVEDIKNATAAPLIAEHVPPEMRHLI